MTFSCSTFAEQIERYTCLLKDFPDQVSLSLKGRIPLGDQGHKIERRCLSA